MHKPQHHLLHWVNRLRQPWREPLMQTNDAGITCVSFSQHDALLERLDAAVIGGTGSKGASGGGMLGSERLPFDQGASLLLEQITAGILERFALTGLDPADYVKLTYKLTAWFMWEQNHVRAGTLTPQQDADETRVVRGWCTQIEAMFDRPRSRELLYPCPDCDETHAWDPDTGNQVRALVVDYREPEVEYAHPTVLGSRCRFCQAEWDGEHGVKWMMHAIQVKEDQTLIDTLFTAV